MSDDDQMISMAVRDVDKDRRISCLKNQILRKSQGLIIAKREKNRKDGRFGGNPATRTSKVAGNHGAVAPFSVAVSSPFFGLFRFCFLLYFSLKFLLIYWLNSSKENLSKDSANQSTKFPIFGKAEDFVADFLPRVETRSNDVGMTWNLR